MIYDRHPAESWIDIFIQDHLRLIEERGWIAPPQPTSAKESCGVSLLAAEGGAVGRYPVGMQQDLK